MIQTLSYLIPQLDHLIEHHLNQSGKHNHLHTALGTSVNKSMSLHDSLVMN